MRVAPLTHVTESDVCVLTERLLVNWQLLAGGLMQICCESQRDTGVTLESRRDNWLLRVSLFMCVCAFDFHTSNKNILDSWMETHSGMMKLLETRYTFLEWCGAYGGSLIPFPISEVVIHDGLSQALCHFCEWQRRVYRSGINRLSMVNPCIEWYLMWWHEVNCRSDICVKSSVLCRCLGHNSSQSTQLQPTKTRAAIGFVLLLNPTGRLDASRHKSNHNKAVREKQDLPPNLLYPLTWCDPSPRQPIRFDSNVINWLSINKMH